MGIIKFALLMLKREKKRAVSFGLSIMFTFVTAVLFFSIINNTLLVDHTLSTSGGSFQDVSIPMSTLVSFAAISFSFLMLGMSNEYFLSHKTKELGILTISGANFMESTFYLLVQTLIISFIAMVPGLILGVGVSVLSNKIMYGYMGIDSTIFYVSPLAFRDTFVTFLAVFTFVVMLDMGFVHRNDVTTMISGEKSNAVKTHGSDVKTAALYIGLVVLGFAMIASAPFSASEYLAPCLVGSFGLSGVLARVVPMGIEFGKRKQAMADKIKIIGLSNLAYSIKRSEMTTRVYNMAMVVMLSLMISQQNNPRNFITSVMAYFVVILLLCVSIVYKYLSEIQSRRVTFFNLYKIGYTQAQIKKCMRYELRHYYGLLTVLPFTICVTLLVIFYSHGSLSLTFVLCLIGIEILPSFVMMAITYRNYTNLLKEIMEAVNHV